MKKIIGIIIIIFILIMILGNNIVSADTGRKPSITIQLENMTTSNYIIDLLVYDETGEKYYSPLDYNGNDGKHSEQYSTYGYKDLRTMTVEQLEKLHKINFDGWISESTRWGEYFLFGNCNGNTKHQHFFNYFGTPETYKVVIINNDNEETKISDVIKRVDYNSKITVDYETMVVKNNINDFSRNFTKILPVLIPVIMTVIIEIIVLACFRMTNKRNTKIVLITNIISNLILQLLLIKIDKIPKITGSTKMNCFFIFEILILIAETFIYYKTLENEKSRKTILYAIIANLTSGFFTFWEWMFSMRFF